MQITSRLRQDAKQAYCDSFALIVRVIRISRAEFQMVVCVCNALREKDVRAAARDGAMTAADAYARFGRRPKCAQCFRFAESILAEERAAAA